MKKLVTVSLVFIILIVFSGLFFFKKANQNMKSDSDSNAEYVVQINEIDQLYMNGLDEEAHQKANELRNMMNVKKEVKTDYSALYVSGICILFVIGVSFYCYRVIIRPFYKLSDFAEQISGGDLDVKLDYERTDYFGKFTWAFDRMRHEIKRARMCEKEAIENSKTVAASLSHDIKTPIASVRAYCEGLEAAMDSDPEKRARYLAVIIRKCDEVTRLTNDMFLHSLSDMDKLKITPEKIELESFVNEVVRDISGEKNDIRVNMSCKGVSVMADRMRTEQVIENLITNARKYAKTEIEIDVISDNGFGEIHVRDHGKGIPDEDMPFVKNKFYRGRNCGKEQGSGLGLYISEYIAVQCGGELCVRNLDDGFEVVVRLPVC